MRRRLLVPVWRAINPLVRRLSGVAPWWVLLETTGRRSGRRRQTPLAAGPTDDEGMWLIAVHGTSAAWLLNLEADPLVRLRHRRLWREGHATVHPMDPAVFERFNAYARLGRSVAGHQPRLVRVTFQSSGTPRP